MAEKTLILLKPDALKRGLAGQILARFEKVGLRLVGLKMVLPTKEIMDQHYPAANQEFLKNLGQRTIETYQENNLDLEAVFSSQEPLTVGRVVQGWNLEFFVGQPIIAAVLAGNQAISIVRKLRGSTIPALSPPGTILGDLATDDVVFANGQQRALRNLLHASATPAEATSEISLWFKSEEIVGD